MNTRLFSPLYFLVLTLFVSVSSADQGTLINPYELSLSGGIYLYKNNDRLLWGSGLDGKGKDKRRGTFVVRMDTKGKVVWQKKFDGLKISGHYFKNSVSIHPKDEAYIFLVSSSETGHQVLKLNSKNGEQLWPKPIYVTFAARKTDVSGIAYDPGDSNRKARLYFVGSGIRRGDELSSAILGYLDARTGKMGRYVWYSPDETKRYSLTSVQVNEHGTSVAVGDVFLKNQKSVLLLGYSANLRMENVCVRSGYVDYEKMTYQDGSFLLLDCATGLLKVSPSLDQVRVTRNRFVSLDFAQFKNTIYFTGWKYLGEDKGGMGVVVRTRFFSDNIHVIRYPNLWRISGVAVDKDGNIHLVGNERASNSRRGKIWVSQPIPAP